MAEEPLIVCMLLKISLTSSCERLSLFSALINSPSRSISSELVSNRYASNKLSTELSIVFTPPYLKIYFCLISSKTVAKKGINVLFLYSVQFSNYLYRQHTTKVNKLRLKFKKIKNKNININTAGEVNVQCFKNNNLYRRIRKSEHAAEVKYGNKTRY